MQVAMKRISFVLILVSILISPQIAFSGDINGRIGFILKSGDVKYGARVKVFLTTWKEHVEPVRDESLFNSVFDYKRAFLDSLFSTYNNIIDKMENPNNIVQTTKSNFDGKFTFKNVSPGEYFIIVTFPTVIAMHKVLWQVPVVMEKENIEVKLDNDNIALAPYYQKK